MKIKRFTGKTMRDAIRQVREEQGPDALILSNRRTAEGIEVVAAVDYDAALMQQSLRTPPTAAPALRDTPPSLPTLLRTPLTRAPAAAPYSEHDGQRHWPLINTPSHAKTAAIEIASHQAEPPRTAATIPAKPAPATASADISELREEISGVRHLLQDQLSGLLWDQLKTRQPRRASVLRALSSLAVAPAIAREIAAEVPEDTADDRARFLPLGLLARRIPIASEDLIMQGGIIALIGPTGVGKTTTLAKLAARYGARHGLRDVALVTTDTWRIGAQEQLYTYGRLLGVPVHTAADAPQLQQILSQLSDRKLILIDTAGMSPHERNLASRFGSLSDSAHPIRSLLVMAANSQAADLDEAARRFVVAKPCGCVLTKLDEASRIGGAISVAINRKLPIAYLCDGQRVPEDLHVAHANRLVIRAQQLSRKLPASLDDDTMALQFGGRPNA